MMKIYHTALWRSKCNKLPNDVQIKYIDEILKKHDMKNHHIRILANFCEYDVDGDWVDRFFKVLEFVKKNGNAQTLEACLLKYGEKNGQSVYDSVNAKKLNTIDSFVKRYGDVEGKKRYGIFCKNNVGNKTIERFIELYGAEEGAIKFQKLRDKEKIKGTLSYFVDRHGPIKGESIYRNITEKRFFALSKEGYIVRHGEIEGIKRFKESRDNVSLSSLIRRYGEKEGTLRYNKFVENCKKRNTLNAHIEKYGEIEGTIKYNNWVNTSAIGVSSFSKISQELFDLIDNPEEKTYYAQKNKEFGRISKNGYYFFDYTNSTRKKIIEFNGDIFHGNPLIFSKDDKPNPFDNKLTCEQMWKNDKEKIDFITEQGFKVLTIWENEYRINKDEIVEKCKKFLYGG